jgi:N6-L-threonylcarbamoyladenine synthase
VKYVLGIETSCDDTSVAIVGADRRVICCLVASQDLVHQPFGGVVPEIASRNHTKDLLPLIDQALQQSDLSWSEISGLAVTNRPGLVGSLLVGLVTVKSLALAKSLPFLGVHHIEGHLMAPFLVDDHYQGPDFFDEDYVALIVSGGHTQLYQVAGFGSYKVLGQTIDDAAGEAFDKFAKMMGLPYPGGVEVDQRARQGDPHRFTFPKPMLREDHFKFSFSGLKSAAQRLLASMSETERQAAEFDLCASYQATIVEVLQTKLEKALVATGAKKFIISGGVSANSGLRAAGEALANKHQLQWAAPPLRYCTDNAAMIGLAGLLRLQRGETSGHDLAPIPRAPL